MRHRRVSLAQNPQFCPLVFSTDCIVHLAAHNSSLCSAFANLCSLFAGKSVSDDYPKVHAVSDRNRSYHQKHFERRLRACKSMYDKMSLLELHAQVQNVICCGRIRENRSSSERNYTEVSNDIGGDNPSSREQSVSHGELEQTMSLQVPNFFPFVSQRKTDSLIWRHSELDTV